MKSWLWHYMYCLNFINVMRNTDKCTNMHIYIYLESCKLHLKYFIFFSVLRKLLGINNFKAQLEKGPIVRNRVAKLRYHKLWIGLQTAKMCRLEGMCLIYPLFRVIEIHCSHPASWQVFQLSGHKIYPSAVFYYAAL